MKRKQLIPIEDQLAPLGGLWEKKPFPWPRFDTVPKIKYGDGIIFIPCPKPKKPRPRPNCARCMWMREDHGPWPHCFACGGETCYTEHGSAFCCAVYKPIPEPKK